MSEEKDKSQDGGDADEVWGEVIHSYSRKQAIEDGVLVDVTCMALQEGFVYPVALTSTLFNGHVVPDESSKKRGESTMGRMHDLFTVLRASIGGAGDTDMLFFEVIFSSHGNPRRVKLKAMIGPGDTMAPVVTIMLPEED